MVRESYRCIVNVISQIKNNKAQKGEKKLHKVNNLQVKLSRNLDFRPSVMEPQRSVYHSQNNRGIAHTRLRCHAKDRGNPSSLYTLLPLKIQKASKITIPSKSLLILLNI